MKIAMSISKTLFKVTLYSLLIISLALAAVFFWLRYEFERAETAQPEFALAHNVIVKALAEKPAVGTDCEQ
ncbi:MAG: uncharacterized membrane protein (DUF106 family), partial [Halioglobus sp.]